MQAQYNENFYTREELEAMGLEHLGENVLISRLAKLYTPHKISIRNNVRIDDFVILSGAIKLGNFIHLGAFSSITGGNGIDCSVKMGDFCNMSGYSKILALTDDFVGGFLAGPCIPQEFRNIKTSHIVLEKYSTLGSHSLVLPGSIFEEGANLGPQSLVGDKTLKAFGYYFGAPARLFSLIDSSKVKDLERKLINSLGGGAELNFCKTSKKMNEMRFFHPLSSPFYPNQIA